MIYIYCRDREGGREGRREGRGKGKITHWLETKSYLNEINLVIKVAVCLYSPVSFKLVQSGFLLNTHIQVNCSHIFFVVFMVFMEWGIICYKYIYTIIRSKKQTAAVCQMFLWFVNRSRGETKYTYLCCSTTAVLADLHCQSMSHYAQLVWTILQYSCHSQALNLGQRHLWNAVVRNNYSEFTDRPVCFTLWFSCRWKQGTIPPVDVFYVTRFWHRLQR